MSAIFIDKANFRCVLIDTEVIEIGLSWFLLLVRRVNERLIHSLELLRKAIRLRFVPGLRQGSKPRSNIEYIFGGFLRATTHYLESSSILNHERSGELLERGGFGSEVTLRTGISAVLFLFEAVIV